LISHSRSWGWCRGAFTRGESFRIAKFADA
jgi:hypothetical protein